ncbi:MAG: permease [Holophagaceae bacterium]|nr:permease [Holophagaceae bacterium]
MDRKIAWMTLCLGCLCMLGPLGTDMNVGALPMIGKDLGASGSSMQLSVTSYFLGFTLGQLFYGPLSDRTGRKPMIYLALGIFVASSVGCCFSTSATQLIAWRFVQGLGGSIGMVMGAAIIRDLYTGVIAAKLMSVVVMIFGLAPIVAPLVGSLILKIARWQTIFAVLGILAVLVFALIHLKLPETRLSSLRAQSRPSAALKLYARFLISRNFIPYAGTQSLVQGGFFAYVAGSPFVLIKTYGLSPLMYSLLFGINAVGLAMGSHLIAHLSARFGAETVVKGATLFYAGAALLLALLEVSGLSGLWVLCILLFAIITALGGIMPACNTLTMEGHGADPGSAAALMGGLGFGVGALGSAMIGAFKGTGALPMLSIIAAFGVLAALVANLSFPGRSKREAEDPSPCGQPL